METPNVRAKSADQQAEPTLWNFKLLGRTTRRLRRHGEGTRCIVPRTAAASPWLAHESGRRISPASTSPIRATKSCWCRPNCRRSICARIRSTSRATSWRSHPNPEGRTAAAVELFDISNPDKARSISLRLFGPDLARRASIVVLRRRIRPHGSGAPDFSEPSERR